MPAPIATTSCRFHHLRSFVLFCAHTKLSGAQLHRKSQKTTAVPLFVETKNEGAVRLPNLTDSPRVAHRTPCLGSLSYFRRVVLESAWNTPERGVPPQTLGRKKKSTRATKRLWMVLDCEGIECGHFPSSCMYLRVMTRLTA